MGSEASNNQSLACMHESCSSKDDILALSNHGKTCNDTHFCSRQRMSKQSALSPIMNTTLFHNRKYEAFF
jgi:hypothetical protein